MGLTGKGFWIWKIPNCESSNVESIANLAQAAHLSHVLVKIADGKRYMNVTTTGTNRKVSTVARNALRRADGWKVRSTSAAVGLRRSRTGGLPSHDEPALALYGVADRTATNASSGTRRPGWVMPELPRNARLPIVARAT